MQKSILITGAGGMMGKEASEIFAANNYQVYALDKDGLDITNQQQVNEFFVDKNFDFILHCAAYTKVDDAQNNEELAFKINRDGAKNIAIAANQKAIPMIYISTDYVFDGSKNSLYQTDDKTNPLNVYGASKLAGEEMVKKFNPKHFIVRTSWLYGKHGKNFVDTMIQLAKTQKTLKIVDDQIGCPTWVVDLIHGIKKLIEEKFSFGTYQICGQNAVSWYGFAQEIFKICQTEIDLIPVSTEDFPRPAIRPKFSAMNNYGLARDWKIALVEYLNLKK